MIFNDQPEISSDLEWILLSGQANRGMLLETLVKDHGVQIYQLAFAVLNNKNQAEQTTIQIILQALNKTRLFNSEYGVKKWLLQVSLPILRKNAKKLESKSKIQANVAELNHVFLESLDWKSRLVLFLLYFRNFEINEIAAILHVQIGWIDKLIKKVQNEPLLGSNTISSSEEIGKHFDEIWGSHDIEELQLETWLKTCQEKTNQKDSKPYSSFHFLETIAISAAILLILFGSWLYSRWLPDPEQNTVAQAQTTLNSTQAIQQITQPLEYTLLPDEELEQVAQRLNLTVEHILNLNQLPPDAQLTAGQKILVNLGMLNKNNESGLNEAELSENVQTFSDEPNLDQPIIARENQPAELDQNSPIDEIMARWQISQNLWQNLFIEGQWADYGPENHLGIVNIQRFQSWIQQPGSSLHKVGPLNASSQAMHLITSGMHITSRPGRELQLAWWETDNLPIISYDPLFTILSPNFFSQSLDIQTISVTGEKNTAGRSTLMIEAYRIDHAQFFRIEIDTQTGVLMRIQVFSVGTGALLAELAVTQIQFDPPFDEEKLFDPLRLQEFHFTNDFRFPFPEGAQISPGSEPVFTIFPRNNETFVSVPDGFDPTSSKIRFQTTQISSENPDSSPNTQIIADGYLLGEIALDPFWQVTCQRSAQGNTLAFFYYTAEVIEPTPGIYWLNLLDANQVYRAMSDYLVFDIAFRPDGMQMAVGARHLNSPDQGLYILDFVTGEFQNLLNLEQASNIIWKPDGQYLAMIGKTPEQDQPSWMIVHIDTGLITSQVPGNMDYVSIISSNLTPNILLPPPDFPAWTWGVDLLNPQNRFNMCSMPGP